MDREKVIKGLKCCCGTDMCFHGCPYNGASKKITECTSQLALEALDLLKEQEEQIKTRDESLEKAREEIKWLRGMLIVNQNNGCGKDKNEPLKISRDWVDEFYGYVAVCPECDCFWIMYQDEDMKFCPGCGQEVKWT